MTLDDIFQVLNIGPTWGAADRLRKVADRHAPNGNIPSKLARELVVFHTVPSPDPGVVQAIGPGAEVDVEALYRTFYKGHRRAGWWERVCPSGDSKEDEEDESKRRILVFETHVRNGHKAGRPRWHLYTTFEGMQQILEKIDPKRVTSILHDHHALPETFYLDLLVNDSRNGRKPLGTAMFRLGGEEVRGVALRELYLAAGFSTPYSVWSKRKIDQHRLMLGRDMARISAATWQKKCGEAVRASLLQYEHVVPLRIAIRLCETLGRKQDELKRELESIDDATREEQA